MALRACKECGQQISTTAKACPLCGKKQGMSTGVGCLVVIGLLIFLGAISHLFESNKDTPLQSTPRAPNTTPAANPPQPTASAEVQTEPSSREAEVYASPEQLMIDRQTGGASAAQKYLGKVVEVQGIVDTANSTGDSPSISFKATGVCAIPGGNTVDCFWMAERERSAVANLHPGDSVTVLGRFAESGRYDMPSGYDIPGCAYYIHLRNCTVKEPAQNPPSPETSAPNSPIIPNMEPNSKPATPGWHRFSSPPKPQQ